MKTIPFALFAVLAGCTASAKPEPEPDRKLEFVYAPITALGTLSGGAVAVGIEPMARAFVIHPELSPDAGALVAFAAQQPKGKPAYATVWIRDNSPKRPPRGLDVVPQDERWPYVIVRLAETPDPRSR